LQTVGDEHDGTDVFVHSGAVQQTLTVLYSVHPSSQKHTHNRGKGFSFNATQRTQRTQEKHTANATAKTQK